MNDQLGNVRPFFSIITVCLNSKSTIDAALKSVAEQCDVGGLVEHIVVDGGSVDGTLEIIARYPNVKCVSEPDNGISDAFNKGIRRATGEVIGFVHADDRLYERDNLSKVLSVFKTSPNEKVVVGKLALDGVVQEFQVGWLQNAYLYFLNHVFCNHETHMLGGYVPHPATYIHTDVYRDVGLYNEEFKIAMDYEFILRLRRRNVTMHYIDDIVYDMSSGGVSTTRVYKAALEAYKAARMNEVPVLISGARLVYTLVSRFISKC